MDVDRINSVGNTIEQALRTAATYLPNLLAALLLLGLGWLLARLLRALSTRLIPRLYRLLPGRRLQEALKASGMERITSEVIGGVVYWLVFLLFIAAATESLGLPVVSSLLAGLARYLPTVLAALLIVVAGIVLSKVARAAVTAAAASARVPYAELPGRVAQVVILLISAVVAVDQIGIDSTFLMIALGVLLWAVIGGVALAFGLGARTTVSNLLASHYLLQTYRVGQWVRIGTQEGRIVEITNTAVVLDTAEGRALVPAREFEQVTSVLLREKN